MKEFLHLCSENCISWIINLFFENMHIWKPHHWNLQEPRTCCNDITISQAVIFIFLFWTKAKCRYGNNKFKPIRHNMHKILYVIFPWNFSKSDAKHFARVTRIWLRLQKEFDSSQATHVKKNLPVNTLLMAGFRFSYANIFSRLLNVA